ncbi:MAG: redoxin domain-containing protein [Planctomycetes bacterium]|nr:redoxin domain-containing protein [Planctomycetota bacterium]
MIELGQLEARHAEFAVKNARIVAASLDDLKHTAETQAKFAHLRLVSDAGRSLAGAADVIGPHHSPQGEDTAAPTTFIIDRKGVVRAIFRPDRYIERIGAEELLAKLPAP